MLAKISGLMGFLIILTFVAPIVSAASFDMAVTPNRVSICPCSSITPETVQVYVTNLHSTADTYTFELIAPETFHSQIQLDTALEPGEEEMLDLFLINVGCPAQQGVYEVTIKAESGVTGDEVSQVLTIEVLKCYDVEMIFDETYKEMCGEEIDSVNYSLSIKNNGKIRETFDLSADVDWAFFSKDTVTLDSEQEESLQLILRPPEGLSGTQEVSVTAKSRTSFAMGTETVTLNILDCFDFGLNLQPVETSVCLGQSVEFKLLINNKGDFNDSFLIGAPEWVTITSDVMDVPGGEVVEVIFLVAPPQKGKHTFEVSVVSKSEPSHSEKITGAVDVVECRGVAIIISPPQVEVCAGLPAEYKVTVKNTGTTEDTFTLKSTAGIFEQAEVLIGPGETETVKLNVNTMELEESQTVTVSAETDGIADTADAELVLMDCYSALISISPEELSVCSGAKVEYDVVVENRGMLADTYSMKFESDFLETTKKEVEVGSGESETFLFEFDIPADAEAGDYQVKASLESEHVSLGATSVLSVSSVEDCYAVELEPKDGMRALDVGNATTVPIIIRNIGENPSLYALSVDGPEWVYLFPDTVELGSGEEEEVYLYITPTLEAESGAYIAKVKASSFFTESELDIAITLGFNVTAPPEEPEEPEVPEEPEEPGEPDVSLNVTIPDNVTGLIISDSEAWKVIVVGIITIVIIIILVIRFALLVKK